MHPTQHKVHGGAPPTLYYDELSPQSRSCCMLIKLLEINVKLLPHNLNRSEHLLESQRKINPCSTIPTLIDGEYVLNDGHTIMIYLCDKYASATQLPYMCPRDYLPRLNILNMLFYEGCVLYRRYINILTEIFLKKYPNVDMSYHQAKVMDSYNSLETNLKGQLCMTGNYLTIADLSVITTLSSLDLMFPILQVQFPNLHRWFENLKNMECYKYNAEGIQKLSHVLELDGQFPIPSPLTLEGTTARRVSFQITVDISNEKLKSTILQENTEFSWNEQSSSREKKVTQDNDGIPSKESLHNSKATEQNFSKFFPKIRTSKIITPPDNEAQFSPYLENIVEKDLRDCEVASDVKYCQSDSRLHTASNCLHSHRSIIFNKSQMDMSCQDCFQKNQRAQSAKCNHNENSNHQMTESTHSCDPEEHILKDVLVISGSLKNLMSKQDINKVKEFESKIKDRAIYYPDNDDQCPCSSIYRQRELWAHDEDEMGDPCPDECECSDDDTDDDAAGNEECDSDCNSQEDSSDEDCESSEDEDSNCDFIDEVEEKVDKCLCRS